ncbi:Fe-S protein assembly co-chaperone HscB [Candidatus Venteria ishoeyi]|uniref:Co-chaperone protein HscB homolog n=1 Tax=Candidatus Venteria ishoeyi TaxID=1899563 RepID=A0A1H6FCT8_9GAMM|nr:Fe-S protein assembly co-chaperone HscB [Candidatus Venteria ishoeyi]MDM8545077.1 Fe-S protein assembly co-chaperone HscB [Candidatus Venteria ishoeyi]SEH07900.1 Uncharacterised protein [Candidatus Venteria ishoeyi]
MSDNTLLTENYFQLFKLPMQFELDITKLRTAYRELQRQFHPDRFAHASDQERRIAMQKTTQINEAFQTLKQPLKRAQYMLNLKGMQPDPQVTPPLEPEFLMTQMELREALEGISQQADPSMVLMGFNDTVSQHIQQFLQQFSTLFQQEKLAQAQTCVNQLHFFYKLQEEAEKLEETLL